MKEKEAKQVIESEFGDLRKEDRSQYETLVSLLVKYGADDSRPLEKLVIKAAPQACAAADTDEDFLFMVEQCKKEQPEAFELVKAFGDKALSRATLFSVLTDLAQEIIKLRKQAAASL